MYIKEESSNTCSKYSGSTTCSIKNCPDTKTCVRKGCGTKKSNTTCSIKNCPDTKTCVRKGCEKYCPYKKREKINKDKDEILIKSIKDLTSSIQFVSDFLSNFNIKKQRLITNGSKTKKERLC
jgi:hypothetical protein